MCGISGIWDFGRTMPPEKLLRVVERMAESLHHRGPDDFGISSPDHSHLALSHTRLSIIDTSSAGRQPMTSSCGRFLLAYNGEIYNAADLRAELRKVGRRFNGSSDTEVLLEGLAEYGIEPFIKRVNGMFAFAFYDKIERELWLCRDRLGIKPLYFSIQNRQLIFASDFSL